MESTKKAQVQAENDQQVSRLGAVLRNLAAIPEEELTDGRLGEPDEEGLRYYGNGFTKSGAYGDDSAFSKMLTEAEELCYTVLMDDRGWPRNLNIAKLGSDFRVYAGDKDSFGWLVGCVQHIPTGRVLVFG